MKPKLKTVKFDFEFLEINYTIEFEKLINKSKYYSVNFYEMGNYVHSLRTTFAANISNATDFLNHFLDLNKGDENE